MIPAPPSSPPPTPIRADDLARAVVRRAERHAVRASGSGRVTSDEVLRYLNRLSDLLFVLARHAAGSAEELAGHD